MNSGFETPKMVTNVISKFETNVTGPKKVDHLWHPITNQNDANLWQNVELHKYGHNVMESHKYNTPAKFTMDKNGDTIVHAPSDSKMRIIKRTPAITSYSGFLDLEDENELIFKELENNLEDEDY